VTQTADFLTLTAISLAAVSGSGIVCQPSPRTHDDALALAPTRHSEAAQQHASLCDRQNARVSATRSPLSGAEPCGLSSFGDSRYAHC
jgi:3,4-dihydroxy-2-butanone 4-phosphate synthase